MSVCRTENMRQRKDFILCHFGEKPQCGTGREYYSAVNGGGANALWAAGPIKVYPRPRAESRVSSASANFALMI